MAERELLPRRPFELVAADPGGFEDAMARGRRRRRRTAGTGLVASLTALVLAVSLTGSSPGPDARLEFILPPERQLVTDTDSDGTDGEGAATVDLAGPATVAGGGSISADTRSAAGDRSGSGGLTRPAQQAPDRGRAAPPPGRRLTPPEETTSQDFATCATGAGGLAVDQTWCLVASRIPDTDDERNSSLTLGVCLRRVESAARTLTFDGEQQVDFVITKEGSPEILWQWSHRAVFGDDPTSDPVNPGECRIYRVRWELRSDNNGRFINEEGTYVLHATSLAAELGDKNTATARFPLN